MPRSEALAFTCRSISALISDSGFRSSHRPSILLRTTMRPAFDAGSSPARCCVHTSRVGLRYAGVGGEDEQHRMRVGQQIQRELGLGPDRRSDPGVSRITRPCCSSGCGKLMTAWRQHGISTAAVAAGRARIRSVAAIQPVFARQSRRTRASPPTRARAPRHPRCRREIEGKRRPLVGVVFELGHRRIAGARFDRQQSDRWRREWGRAAISVGHIVVRPADDGRSRCPKSAKKIALISSDLPRENSATNATMSLS